MNAVLQKPRLNENEGCHTSDSTHAARCAGLDGQHALHAVQEAQTAPMSPQAARTLPLPRETAAVAASPPSTPAGECSGLRVESGHTLIAAGWAIVSCEHRSCVIVRPSTGWARVFG